MEIADVQSPKMFFFLTLHPLSVFAYSEYIIASGQNIGIELKSDYLYKKNKVTFPGFFVKK